MVKIAIDPVWYLPGIAQLMRRRVEKDVALKGARRFTVEAEPGERCLKGLQVADAELDLDLNRLHANEFIPFS